jgi:hypothetical protein
MLINNVSGSGSAPLTYGPDPALFVSVLQDARVADPDWIRIQSGQWIRIQNPDPDPGGQKIPTKVEKISKSSCFEVLDGLF